MWANFDDFFQAFTTVFQILTFDNWPPILHNAMKVWGGAAAALLLTGLTFPPNHSSTKILIIRPLNHSPHLAVRVYIYI